jgi:hypothetical protein
MGSFEMLVRRSTKGSISSPSLNGAASNGAVAAPPPASAFASTQSMDIPAGDYPAAQSVSVSSVDEDIDDESTIYLTAPKVTHLNTLLMDRNAHPIILPSHGMHVDNKGVQTS